MKTKFIQHSQCLFFKQASQGHCLHFQNIVKYFHISLKVGLYDEIFLSRPWNFYFERKMSKYFRKRNACRENIIQLVQTIKFHSCDHENVSFIERLNNFHFSCHRYYSFKSCLKILKKRNYVVSDWGKRPN